MKTGIFDKGSGTMHVFNSKQDVAKFLSIHRNTLSYHQANKTIEYRGFLLSFDVKEHKSKGKIRQTQAFTA